VRITPRQALPMILLLPLLCGGEGCETRHSPQTADTPTVERSDIGMLPRNDWREVDDSPQVALPADAEDEALATATARAQATAEAARVRWRDATPEARRGWAIRWAAPTADGRIEYVWVEPINWSRHRIEGRLANPPQRELTCGKRLDDLVSFPIEQLADWVAPPAGPIAGADETDHGAADDLTGGFTVRLMEERYGRTVPPAERDADGR
jgi:uncharacterized protein YegJ (DUF2314 family)